MRFLKAITKFDLGRERPDDESAEDSGGREDAGRKKYPSPEALDESLVIGRPSKAAAAALSRSGSNGGGDEGEDPDTAVEEVVGSDRDVKIETVDLSEDREAINPLLVAITQPGSPYSEAYRSLRTSVIHSCRERRAKSVIVTSLEAAEGKSITAFNLAWLLAQTSGARTLLVDGDMRRPTLGRLVGLEREFGLPELLSGKCGPEEALVCLKPSGLFLLPGSKIQEDPADYISGTEFLKLKSEIEKVFDYIIFDSPPLCVFSDAEAMLNRSDAGLLVIGADMVQSSKYETVLSSIPKNKIIGSVLNMADDPGRQEYLEYPGYWSAEA